MGILNSIIPMPQTFEPIYRGLFLIGSFILGYTVIADYFIEYLRRSIEGKGRPRTDDI